MIALASGVGGVVLGRMVGGVCVGVQAVAGSVFMPEVVQLDLRDVMAFFPAVLGNLGQFSLTFFYFCFLFLFLNLFWKFVFVLFFNLYLCYIVIFKSLYLCFDIIIIITTIFLYLCFTWLNWILINIKIVLLDLLIY